MDFVGIDIGSTSAKMVVLGSHPMQRVIPTGWSSKDAAAGLREILIGGGVSPEAAAVYATGYGRNAVPYATKAKVLHRAVAVRTPRSSLCATARWRTF